VSSTSWSNPARTGEATVGSDGSGQCAELSNDESAYEEGLTRRRRLRAGRRCCRPTVGCQRVALRRKAFADGPDRPTVGYQVRIVQLVPQPEPTRALQRQVEVKRRDKCLVDCVLRVVEADAATLALLLPTPPQLTISARRRQLGVTAVRPRLASCRSSIRSATGDPDLTLQLARDLRMA